MELVVSEYFTVEPDALHTVVTKVSQEVEGYSSTVELSAHRRSSFIVRTAGK
jgi:hypothetical protein